MEFLSKFWHHNLKRPHKLHVYHDSGSGEPIVMLHGLASSSVVWEPLISLLSVEPFRLVAVDLLGFGGSPKPSYSDYDIEAHAAAVATTLRSRRVKSATIVGHSMGCLVATHLAVRYPHLVKKLVLYEPPLFADDPAYRSHARRREMYLGLFEAVLNRPQLVLAYSRVLRGSLSRWMGVSFNEQTWLPFDRSLRNTIMRQSAYSELRAISVKTDIIHGRFDVMVTRTDIKKMFKDNPNIRLHLLNQTHDVTASAAVYIAKLL